MCVLRVCKREDGEVVLVPLVDAAGVPVPQSGFDFLLALAPLALEFLHEQTELLAEGVEALPPVRAAVLVPVADEDFVEQFVDIVEHGDFVR